MRGLLVRRLAVGIAFSLAVIAAVLTATTGLSAARTSGASVAEVDIYPTQIVWTPTVAHSATYLTVSGPNGTQGSQTFEGGTNPVFLAGANPNGSYTYQLVAVAPLSSSARNRMEQVNGADERALLYQALVNEGEIPATAPVQSGSFTIEGGLILGSSFTSTTSDQDNPLLRTTFNEDVIVDGSLCVGLDCVTGEVFGFDTIRLKENNLRIKFEDTSGTASFPTNDWQLTINDSNDGGAEKFAIEDITNSRIPFTVRGNAPTNSLFIAAGTGHVGLGTATPVVEIHSVDGDTPTLRLEQDGSSGFTAQTWDMAGNESNFFIRDVTNSSQLPFRIRPGADTSSIDIRSDDDVAIGADFEPSAQLEVRSDTDDVAKFTNQSDTTSAVQISVVQGTPAEPKVEFITPTDTWSIGIDGVSSNMKFQKASIDVLSIDHLTHEVVFAGGVTANGGVMHASDADRKEQFEDVDTEALLERALDLRIASWQYKADATGARHIGPTAQDFSKSFGVGTDDKYINTIDADGVALGAIQGLNARLIKALDERDARIAELEARITALEADE